MPLNMLYRFLNVDMLEGSVRTAREHISSGIHVMILKL